MTSGYEPPLGHTSAGLRVYLITVLAVIFLNLLKGVDIGVAVAVLVLIWRLIRAEMSAEQFGTSGSR